MVEKKSKKVSNRNPLEILGSAYAGSGFRESNAYNYEELAQYAQNRDDLITYQRFYLENLYVSSGLIKRIVDMPVEDAFKQGVTIKSEAISSASDLRKLNNWVDRILLPQFKTAKKLARLFGGSALIISGGLSEQDKQDLQQISEGEDKTSYDLKTELDLNNIKQGDKIAFYPVSQWELSQAGVLENPEFKDVVLNPMTFGIGNYQEYNYAGAKVDKSRIVPFIGIEAPSLIKQRLRGWGVSVIESAVTPLQTYYKEAKVLFEIIDETKIDVLQIDGLSEIVQSDDGIAKIDKLVNQIAHNKNYKGVITLDGKSNYQAKQLNFDGIEVAYRTLETNLASNIGIPKNKLFGDSTQGVFATGNDAIENYNTMVQNIQQEALPQLENLIKIGLKTVLGLDWDEIEEGLEIDFPSLKILSDEEQSLIDDRKFSALNQLYANGILNAHQLKEQINAIGILPVALDVESGPARPDPNIRDTLVEEKDYV